MEHRKRRRSRDAALLTLILKGYCVTALLMNLLDTVSPTASFFCFVFRFIPKSTWTDTPDYDRTRDMNCIGERKGPGATGHKLHPGLEWKGQESQHGSKHPGQALLQPKTTTGKITASLQLPR